MFPNHRSDRSVTIRTNQNCPSFLRGTPAAPEYASRRYKLTFCLIFVFLLIATFRSYFELTIKYFLRDSTFEVHVNGGRRWEAAIIFERQVRGGRSKRKAVEPSLLWPQALIHFSIDSPEPDLKEVAKGIQHWEENTCLRFVEVQNSTDPHIKFKGLNGCRSSVGRQRDSGQVVSIGPTCNKLGIVVHEIGHALGFYHEIRRPDRDEHIVINMENVEDGELFNFHKLDSIDIDIPYDLSSVMHYRSLEWSRNGQTTVATRDPMLQGIIGVWKGKEGYSVGLSHRDKLLANAIYDCIGIWLHECNYTKNPCQGEGYLGASCECVCPPNRSGPLCETLTGSYYDSLKSHCSQDITYETIISSPHYPHNYDPDTWCTFRIDAGQCQVPVLTILDFQMGPRDNKNQCFHDFLEIRHESPYAGVMKCASEVTPGETFRGNRSQMILFFKAEVGGYRGFKARITFEEANGCCRTRVNGSEFHLLSPNYPKAFEGQFRCNITLKPKSPAKLKISTLGLPDSDDVSLDVKGHLVSLPCQLMLCQVDGLCLSFFRDKINTKGNMSFVLPSSGSTHSLKSSSSLRSTAIRLVFTMEPSPCHKIISLTRKKSMRQIRVGPLGYTSLQCEWWINAPSGYHVQLTKERILMKSVDSFLTLDEVGDPSYPLRTSRTFRTSKEVPESIVSINSTLNLVFQGDASSHVAFTFQLYRCFDQHDDCAFWASIGECQNNSNWMMEFCKYSCMQCEYPVKCLDKHQDCVFWAQNKQCLENEDWMRLNCAQSCEYCEPCTDQNRLCDVWQELGHCASNPTYMENFCMKTCNFCGEANTVDPGQEKRGASHSQLTQAEKLVVDLVDENSTFIRSVESESEPSSQKSNQNESTSLKVILLDSKPVHLSNHKLITSPLKRINVKKFKNFNKTKRINSKLADSLAIFMKIGVTDIPLSPELQTKNSPSNDLKEAYRANMNIHNLTFNHLKMDRNKNVISKLLSNDTRKFQTQWKLRAKNKTISLKKYLRGKRKQNNFQKKCLINLQPNVYNNISQHKKIARMNRLKCRMKLKSKRKFNKKYYQKNKKNISHIKKKRFKNLVHLFNRNVKHLLNFKRRKGLKDEKQNESRRDFDSKNSVVSHSKKRNRKKWFLKMKENRNFEQSANSILTPKARGKNILKNPKVWRQFKPHNRIKKQMFPQKYQKNSISIRKKRKRNHVKIWKE